MRPILFGLSPTITYTHPVYLIFSLIMCTVLHDTSALMVPIHHITGDTFQSDGWGTACCSSQVAPQCWAMCCLRPSGTKTMPLQACTQCYHSWYAVHAITQSSLPIDILSGHMAAGGAIGTPIFHYTPYNGNAHSCHANRRDQGRPRVGWYDALSAFRDRFLESHLRLAQGLYVPTWS